MSRHRALSGLEISLWVHLNLRVTHSTDPLKPSGNFVHHRVQHSQILRSAHTVHLCVLYGSENKQRLFHCTALNDWFYNRDGVCLLRGTD
jgi:hypothetical protein